MKEEAIASYARAGGNSQQKRDSFVTDYLPLVHHVLGRLPIHLPVTLDRDDLYGVGVLGLMQAADTFDPTRGASFKTHAFVNIRGAILDELRRHDPVPRSRRDRLKLVGETEKRLEEELGRPPTPEEIGQAAGLTQGQVDDVLVHAQGINIMSLEDRAGGSSDGGENRILDCLQMPESPDPGDEASNRELKRALAVAIQELPERERRVIVLYYAEGLLLKEIGEVMSITESRVSQLHSRAVYRLNRALSTSPSKTAE